MASSHSEDFDLFDALSSQQDLLELVVQQCSGHKNNLRLACSRLRAAVDACVTGLAWTKIGYLAKDEKHMAVLSRCPRLQALNFNGQIVEDLLPLASCIGLRRVTGLRAACWTRAAYSLGPLFAALTHLEHLECSHSEGMLDISALAACTSLKYLDCSLTMIKEELPPLPVCLESLICHHTALTDISAVAACTALKHLQCSGCDIAILPALPAGLETLNISGTRCDDLSPLAVCAAFRRLDCIDTPVQDLMPLLACKQLEVLACPDFDGVADQTNLLLQAHPDLCLGITGSENSEDVDEDEDDWDGEGEEDDGDGFYDYWDSMSDGDSGSL